MATIPCFDAFHQLRLPLLPSEAVLNENCSSLGVYRSRWSRLAVRPFRSTGPRYIEDAELQPVHGLMSRYWDRTHGFCRWHARVSWRSVIFFP